jgi:hypothetical protein
LGQILWRGVLWMLMGCVAVYGLDWALWQVRMLAGGGYRVVSVDRFVVAPLKGGKEEYYPDGRTDVRCTVSLLPEGVPQVGGQPCWWVQRHPIVFER